MTPREIIKKIRQIEIRTNCLVTISPLVFQLSRVTAGMENGQDHNSFGFDHKMNDERKTAKDHRTPDFAAHFRKAFRIIRDTLKTFLNYRSKFPAQAFALVFI